MKPITTIIFILALTIAANAQCTGTQVCVEQETIDRATEAAEKLKATLVVISNFEAERAANAKAVDALKLLAEAKDAVIAAQAQVISIKDQKEAAYQNLIKIYEQMDAVKDKIIAALEKQLYRPKSTLQKILSGVKEVLKAALYVMAGAGVGRVL